MGRCRNRQVVESLVRAMFIEEANILPADGIEMAEAEAEEVVQAFAFERANPRFGECVRVGSQQGCLHTADVRALEQAAEPCRELGVAVVDEKACLNLPTISRPR